MLAPMSTTPPPFPPPRPRPSGWWFVVGVALLLAAGAVFGWFLFRAIDGFAEIEAHVPADGAVHEVDVGAEEDKFLWVQEHAAADCQVRDRGRGSEIEILPVSGTYSRADLSEAWVADGHFDSGSGRLSVTCSTSGGPAEIGPAVDIGGFLTSLLLAIGVPLLLGGGGVVVLVVTGLLWAIRPARAA